MNTSGTFTSPFESSTVGYSSPAGNVDKFGKGPLESPVVKIVQETRNLGNGEFVAVKEAKPALTPAQKRMFSQIKHNETKGVNTDTSPSSSPEVAPESPKRDESKKEGAGKKEKQTKARSEKAPSPVYPRRSAISFSPNVEVVDVITTTPVTRQPSVFKPESDEGEVVTTFHRQADGTVKIREFTPAEHSKFSNRGDHGDGSVDPEEKKTAISQPAIQADKTQPKSKVKLLGVIALVVGIATAAFGFFTANFLAMKVGFGMMGFGCLSYLAGRRIEAAQARKQYLDQFRY